MKHQTILSLFCVIALLFAPAQSFGQSSTQEEPVTVLENFSPFELTMTGIGAVGMITLLGWGSDIFGDPIPGMGSPHPDSVDWRFTHWANPNPDPTTRWLGGVPDRSAYAMPALTFSFYAAGAIGSAFNEDFILGDQTHELIAYTEALSWATVTVNALKLLVGRQRPFAVRQDIDKSQVDEDPKEQVISFPSGHSASAAVTTVFIALDLGDYLVHSVLKDSPEAVKIGVGRALPLLAAGGITWTVMYSRIRDQKHWLSDTVTGALIGTGFAFLFYNAHFEDGKPKRNHPKDSTPLINNARMSIVPFSNNGAQLRYGFTF